MYLTHYISMEMKKVDDLIGRIFFTVASQFEFQTKNRKNFGGKFKGGLNKLFSQFGLPEIEIEFDGNIEHKNIKSVVSSITFDSKVDILISYYKKNGRYPCIDLLHKDYYEYENNKKVSKDNYFDGLMVGCIAGEFAAKRIYPPVKSPLSLSHDVKIFDEKRMHGIF